MRYRTKVAVTVLGALSILGAGALPVLGQASGPGDDPPVTLRLADPDPPHMQSAPEAAFFAQRVKDLSGGSITIEFTSDAGNDTAADLGTEAAVIKLVEAGDYDLGMTTTRPWDLLGVTSLQAIQAPFLIDNTALAIAVARSDIAQRALSGLASVGLTGFELWPEHMRYLFAYPASGKKFLSPADVAGSVLTLGFSKSGRRYFTDLGATIWDGSDIAADIDSGALKGGEFGFFNGPANDGGATATGNLVFYPRTKMLFGNTASLASLSDAQRAALVQAARDTRDDAISHVADEPAQAIALCGLDGHVVFADDAAIKAFHDAAAPTLRDMAKDPLTAQLISDITVLKQTTVASPAVQPCDPPAGTELYPLTDPTDFQATIPPAGSYRYDETVEGQMARGVDASSAAANAGVTTFTFGPDGVTFMAVNPDGPHVCHATAAVTDDGRAVHLETAPGGQCGITTDILWRPDGDGIQLILSTPPSARGTPAEITEWLNFRGQIEGVRWVKIQ